MLTQFVRYGVVGLTSNAMLYFGYLGLTWLGVGYKLAMTALYCVGVMQTFVFNRRWTFRHDGNSGQAFRRYVIAYLLGYALNFLALVMFVDYLGWPHQLVQGIMILVLACFLFVLQRLWVFSVRPGASSEQFSGDHSPGTGAERF
jgi:putative flippase GtrA